ncbi:Putative dihydroneopterin aldolase/epimerase domain-containing protein [Septoria linicola]|uniref:Dihydroneopterin aldolase/epimerase domain-containing protein n=1 Tax=Septoria linicola TaxID=215465 RepID=A0A9Q9ANC8_9PEZI|nr:putative dihydroneopterin aldolase/epimerase domain-containing protein [Septoria linicola]USW49167.1 Putative dihydroneopterin aldolase/epimerase domain-containing protein [Septoria linicola]
MASPQDSIQIKNLQLPFPVVAPDVWGNLKGQPALVSVRLRLHNGFSTASDADKLDESTIHYGNLAKAIRSSSRQGQSVENVTTSTKSAIEKLALKSEGKFIVSDSDVELHLPKASMLGTGVVITLSVSYDQSGRARDAAQTFELRDIAVPTLIGVNAYERAMKQPLVVSLAINWDSASDTEAYEKQKTALFNTEKTLVEIIQDTAYETLETLVEVAYAQLTRQLPHAAPPGTILRLRIEKPRAIAFADAPVLEIVRVVTGQTGSSKPVSPNATLSSELSGLSIVKPYSVVAEQSDSSKPMSQKTTLSSGLSGLSIVKPYAA